MLIGWRLLRTCKRISFVALAWLCLASGGCKTQRDATAAATQMAATAQAMSDYYGALDHVLANTQLAYDAQMALNKVPSTDLSDTRAQIQLRGKLANDVAELSSGFAKITSSKAPSDASTAAGKLNTELGSVTPLTSSSTEQKVLTTAVQLVVSLLQQHDEVKAAKQIEPVCHALSAFFDSESTYYDSINQSYLILARSNAQYMVEHNLVDTSQVFSSSLRPFSLTPSTDSQSIKTGMQDYLKSEIDSGYASKLAAAQKATQAMSASLKEMDTRISLVMTDKPLSVTLPPMTLSGVESWVASMTN